MKLRLDVFLAISALAFNAAAQPASTTPPAPQPPSNLAPAKPAPPTMPDADTLGYAFGVNIGTMSKKQHFDLNADSVAQAIKDVLADKPLRISEPETRSVFSRFQGAMQIKMQAERAKLASENKIKSEAFMATNAKAPGVITVTNGLQYKVISEGSGAIPKRTDAVTVSYRATLPDGSLADANESYTTLLDVGGLRYRFWPDIVTLMKTGSKYQVFVGPEYSSQRLPPSVPPNSVLTFDVELLSISAPKPASFSVPPSGTANSTTPVVSGQIIKVPSAEDLKKGAKIEVITNMPGSK